MKDSVAASWILKTKDCHKLPQSTFEMVIEDLTLLFQFVHDSSLVCYNESQKLSSLNQDQLNCLSEVFEPIYEFLSLLID